MVNTPTNLPSSLTSKIFQPMTVGNMTLAHRIVMAPLTRFRANKDHVHGDLAREYYAQRASVRGTLLITEATYIAKEAGGLANIPGVYSEEQIAAWKTIVDAVHAKGSFIFLQIWALGRAAEANTLKSEDPSFEVVSASDLKLSDRPDQDTPRPLTIPEIHRYVQHFATAASNAVHKAGFDGVEVHGAHGYLIDQFTQDVSNKRTDEYGGSVENRTRFALEVLDAVTKAVGQEKVGFRMSPWSRWQDQRMNNPIPTFTHLVTSIRDSFPNLAYISLVEPRISGPLDEDAAPPIDPATGLPQVESNDFIRKIWAPRVAMSAGHKTMEDVAAVAERGELVAMGRYFISNPDLPSRIKENTTWSHYDRTTFYTPESPKGYVDYPFANGVANGAAGAAIKA